MQSSPLPSSSEECVSWMESAVQQLSSNPRQAEAAILELRSSPRAIDIAMVILEQSRVPLARFHGVTTLQAVVLQQWDTLPFPHRLFAREYVWKMLLAMVPTVREDERFVFAQMIHTVSVLWKRSWSDEAVGVREEWLNQVRSLAESADRRQRLLAARILTMLVEEFGSTSATRMSMPLEFHKRAHASFQNLGLVHSLDIAMRLLGGVLHDALMDAGSIAGSNLSEQSCLELYLVVVNLSTVVLSWESKSPEVWQVPSSNSRTCPGPSWRPFVVRPDLLGAVFAAYGATRQRYTGRGGHAEILFLPASVSLLHAFRQLLLQLACMSGDIFESELQRRGYASFLLEGISSLLSSLQAPLGSGARSTAAAWVEEDAVIQERIDIASISCRLISNFGLMELSTLPVFQEYAEHLASLTRVILEAAALAATSSCDLEESAHMECFAELLQCWVLIVNDTAMVTRKLSSSVRERLCELARQVYADYAVARLAISRTVGATSAEEEELSEVEAIGAADIEEELVMVSSLGRMSMATLPGLLSYLQRALCDVSVLVQSGCLPGGACATDGHGNLIPAAVGVLEESRMMILLVGYILADEDEGESPMIPEAMLEPLTLDDSAAVLVVELVKAVLDALGWFGEQLVRGSPGQCQALSPMLAQALLWCTARLARTYLLPDPGLYDGGECFGRGLSQPLVDAFAPGVSSAAISDFLLQSVTIFLWGWPGEPDVCEGAIRVLGALLSRSAAPTVTALPRWQELVLTLGRDRRLAHHDASTVLTHLVKGGLLAGRADAMARFQYTVAPVQSRFDSLVTSVEAMPKIRQQDIGVVQEVEACLDLYSGVVKGGDSEHADEMGFFVEGSLCGLIKIFRVYSVLEVDTVVLGALSYLRDVASLQLVFMKSRRTRALFDACGEVLKLYAAYRKRRFVQLAMEEWVHDDILVLLELLGHLVTKDCVNLSVEDESKPSSVPPTISLPACDAAIKVEEVLPLSASVRGVVLFGLGEILPLMSDELMNVPMIQSQFFSMISFVIETYAGSLGTVDPNLVKQLIRALVYGAQQVDTGVARNSLRALAAILRQCASPEPNLVQAMLSQWPGVLVGLLSTLLDLILSDVILWDRIESLAESLFLLILMEKAAFERLVCSMVEEGGHPERQREALRAAFSSLVSENGLEMKVDRHNLARFQKNLVKFSMTAHALFIVK
jgi:hypothetical protein